jgi:small ligand-binding sensory domain FIST
MRAEAAITQSQIVENALEDLVERLPMLSDGTPVDLALLFASDWYEDEYGELMEGLKSRLGDAIIIGCSGQGVIGPGEEVETYPAISLQLFSLPGAMLRPVRLSPEDIASQMMANVWAERLEKLTAQEVNAWLFFVDPFTTEPERLLNLMKTMNAGVPLIGGLASGDQRKQRTYLFLNGEVIDEGAVGLAVGGDYEVRTVVSQGAQPIGQTWTITGAQANYIVSIGNKPALEVLQQTFAELSPEMQERAQSNLLIGLAMDEYRDEFGRGDFLIRNLLGVDRESGAVAISAIPREGQTMQFQVRDPEAADDELSILLKRARDELGGRQPVGALLCACNGRGAGLFGAPNHDAQKLEELLGSVPVAGFFCNGEIGPVGKENYLHGFTASIGLIVPKATAQA